jgi:hypothetical protein
MDLVEIWNLNDRTQVCFLPPSSDRFGAYGNQYLSSDGFKAQMSHLVKDLVVPAGMMLE